MFAATTASPPTTQRTGQLDADGWPGGRPSASRARTRTKIRRPSFVAVPPFPSVTVRSAVYRPGTVYRCSAESPEEPDPSPKFQVYVNASPSGSVACAVKLTSATGVGLGGRSCSTTVWASAVASPIVGARFGCRTESATAVIVTMATTRTAVIRPQGRLRGTVSVGDASAGSSFFFPSDFQALPPPETFIQKKKTHIKIYQKAQKPRRE